jgi:hypothetical protein
MSGFGRIERDGDQIEREIEKLNLGHSERSRGCNAADVVGEARLSIRRETFKVTRRDPSVRAGLADSLGMTMRFVT